MNICVHIIILFFLINQGLVKSDVPLAQSYLPTQKLDVLYGRSLTNFNKVHTLHVDLDLIDLVHLFNSPVSLIPDLKHVLKRAIAQ